jgi:hypothetical protein
MKQAKTKESADAQTDVATGDAMPARPRDPRHLAIINPAKVTDSVESDIAPAVSSPPGRALTRRSMFMGIAVPALTGAAITPSAAADILGKADPIFAVIERHRQIMEAYCQAVACHQQLRKEHEAKQDPRGVYLYDAPETEMVVNCVDGTTCKLDDDRLPLREGESWSIVPTGGIAPVFAHFPVDIVRADQKYIGCDDFEAWQAEKLEEYWKREGLRGDGPLHAAWDAINDAHERLIVATAGLNARPATLAGVAALLRTVAESYDGDDGDIWGGMVYDHDEDGECIGDPVIDNTDLMLEIVEMLADVVQSLAA